MVGVVGYAVPNEIGLMVRDLRKHFDITSQLSIYHHGLGGFEMDQLAANTWLNGPPPDYALDGRWEWEIQLEDLLLWSKDEQLTTIFLVGSTYGERTIAYAREAKLKTILLATETMSIPSELDLTIYTSMDLYREMSVYPGTGRKVLLHWPETDAQWELLRPMWWKAMMSVA